MVENTDEEQEEISIVESIDADTNKSGIGAWFSNLFGYMQTSSQ